ncbi:hypothetical protein HDZ31DRAFT_44378 [Schizophyllum fasciatum]
MKYKSMLLPKDPLLALPTELVCQILEYLDVADLLVCSLVTRHLRRVIRHSAPLQYAIELAKCRMAPVHTAPTLSTASRLNALRDRERAWRALRWSARHRITLPPTGPIYEFIGGIYGNGQEDENRVTSSISFFELPTHVRGRTLPDNPRVWTHSMGALSIIDFTLDPTQDLLALVALAAPPSDHLYEIHLRSLTTNKPHPMAQLSTLCCLKRPDGNHAILESAGAVRIQVSAEHVALLVRQIPGMGAHLNIWNWKRGADQHTYLSVADGIEDFTFLSDQAFLLVRPKGSFETYTFDTPACSAPEHRATYLFPPLNPNHTYWYITMSSNPSPGYRPATEEVATPTNATTESISVSQDPSRSPLISPSARNSGATTSSQGPAFEEVPLDSDTPFIIPTSTSSPFSQTSTTQPSPSTRQSTSSGSSTSAEAEEAASRSYYPRPDDRIHSCCVYTSSVFPVLEEVEAELGGIGGNAHANIGLDGGAQLNANGGLQANGGVAPDPHAPHRHYVHSFVFFVNLKVFLRDLREMEAERTRELVKAAAEARAREEWARQARERRERAQARDQAEWARRAREANEAAARQQREEEKREIWETDRSRTAGRNPSARQAEMEQAREREQRASEDRQQRRRRRTTPSTRRTARSSSRRVDDLSPPMGSPAAAEQEASASGWIPHLQPAQWSPPSTPGPGPSAAMYGGPSTVFEGQALWTMAEPSTSTWMESPLAADPPSPFLTSTGNNMSATNVVAWNLPGPSSWNLYSPSPTPTLPSIPQAFYATMPQTLLPHPQSFHIAPDALLPVPPAPPGMLPTLTSLFPTMFPHPNGTVFLPPPHPTFALAPPPAAPVLHPPTHPAPSPAFLPQHVVTLPPLAMPARRRRPRVHAWHAWGPRNTRWFRECLSTDWQHAIYGLRAIDSVRVQPIQDKASSKSSTPSTFSDPDQDAQPGLEARGLEILPTDDEDDLAVLQGLEQPHMQRHLRLRDFNSYFVAHPELAEADWGLDIATDGVSGCQDKSRPRWRAPRVVTGPSITTSRGVFREDLVSELPYVEVISEEAFDVTDVMMDDCRILLLTIQGQRGGLNKLKGIDVLTM